VKPRQTAHCGKINREVKGAGDANDCAPKMGGIYPKVSTGAQYISEGTKLEFLTGFERKRNSLD
jgi:hypothetical protein